MQGGANDYITKPFGLPELTARIRVALRHTQGHRQDAAKLLGWGRNTLTRKLKELGMSDLDRGPT